MIVIFFILKNLILFFNSRIQSKFYKEFSTEISDKILLNYLKKDLLFFSKEESSNILRNTLNESKQFSRNYAKSLTDIFSESILFIFILFFIIYFDTKFSYLLLLIFCIFSFFYLFLSKKFIQNLGIKRLLYDGKKIKALTDSIMGIRQIKSIFKENFFFKIFSNYNEKSNYTLYKQELISVLPKLLLEILVILCLVYLIILGIKSNLNTTEIVTKIGVLVAISYKLMPSINKFLIAFQTIRFAKKSVSILEKIITEQEPNNQIIDCNKINFNNKISISNLSFSYDNKIVYDELNEQIFKNEIIGISGKSGSGKSTLALIIMGLLKPCKGVIKIDEYILGNTNTDWLSKIGYVDQNTFIISDTLENNIAFAQDKETVDFDKVEDICKQVELSDLRKFLKEKKNSMLHEFGADISTGQRQRIGIARAIYKNPELLIFDEATNALDSEIEKKILNMIIKNYKRNKTIIFISHKKEIIQICDKVILLK